MGVGTEARHPLRILKKAPLRTLLCCMHTYVFQLFSKGMPQKGCFLFIPLMAMVLGQQEKSRSRAQCLVDLWSCPLTSFPHVICSSLLT